ncbi:glucuronate isomerase [Paenibacillus swuensis]|uniref:Uronate isomerase n=1 Tax=Paenibacillus swuensis TaxID=1178515 RepID=A0A172TMW9_9BACL|nr:glucuronate isomerase [Paenibacillus swuensis]ANE48378.1 glucuronate isomerase [Paenibacillus swuensis]
MRTFMDADFMLMNKTAVSLYHEVAAHMPIIDYHCHLDPKEIYENKRYTNLAEVWLYGDHYKWRAMRANGEAEELVTGGEGVQDYDRFLAWTRTLPMMIGNPLYHWSHLELRRMFGIDELIHEGNAKHIWDTANALLQGEGFAARDFIRRSNVEVICTTDDPSDSLEYHMKLREEVQDFQVLPTYRPDKYLDIRKATFPKYLKKLEEVTGAPIDTYDALLSALASRIEFFHQQGCRISDHGLDFLPYEEAAVQEVADIFARALQGEELTLEDEIKYKTQTLVFLGGKYAAHGWSMQFHMNAHRNNNSRMFSQLGPDAGFDTINDAPVAAPLVGLLDAMERDHALPRTIVYSLNARDNEVLASIIGSFQGDGIPGKMQLGSAWWFNDTKDGMLNQLNTLASLGMLGRFVGMLTDSRSFLSYTRHEYFRRILCNLIGEWVERGEVPDEREMLDKLIEGICYENARTYFRFE